MTKIILPALIGLLLGMVASPWLLPPTPCPDCNCPPAVAFNLARTQLADELKKLRVRGDLDLSIDISGGPFYLINAPGDTMNTDVPQQFQGLRFLPIDSMRQQP